MMDREKGLSAFFRYHALGGLRKQGSYSRSSQRGNPEQAPLLFSRNRYLESDVGVHDKQLDLTRGGCFLHFLLTQVSEVL